MSYVDLGDECPSCRMTYLTCEHSSGGTATQGVSAGGLLSAGGRSKSRLGDSSKTGASQAVKQCECTGDISLYGRCIFCVFDRDKYENTDDDPYSISLEVFERGRRHGKEGKRALYILSSKDQQTKSLYRLYRAGYYYGVLESPMK